MQLVEISLIFLGLAVVIGEISKTERFNRVDRERAAIHKDLNMVKDYLKIHKEEYIGKGYGKKPGSVWEIMHPISVIKERYVSSEEKKTK
jgi:hypothetical protein